MIIEYHRPGTQEEVLSLLVQKGSPDRGFRGRFVYK